MIPRLAVALVITTFIVSAAEACSCHSPVPADAFDAVSDVFLGRAVGLELNPGDCGTPVGIRWRFKKSGTWKGSESQVAYVHTDCSSATCGYEFELNEEYIVFADESELFAGLYTHLCSGTVASQWADAELLTFLGDAGPVTPVAASSWSTLKSRY